jgi:hypothetical protein
MSTTAESSCVRTTALHPGLRGGGRGGDGQDARHSEREKGRFHREVS